MGWISDLELRLQFDPKFAELGYEEQLKARQMLVLAQLQKDPKFLALPAASQEAALAKLSLGLPALQDKKKQNEFKRLIEAADSGDAAAQNTIGAFLGNRTIAGAGILGNLTERAVGGIAGVVNRISGGKFDQAATFAQMEYLTGADSDKMDQYTQMRAQQDPKSIYAQAQRGRGFLNFEAGLLDAIPLYMVLPNAVSAPLKAAIERSPFFARHAGLVSRVILKSAIPELSEEILSGALSIAQQNVLAAMTQNKELYTNTAAKIGKAGMTGFGMGLFGGMVARELLPAAFTMMKGTFKGFGKVALGESESAIVEAIGSLVRGETLDEVLSKGMSSKAQADRWFNGQAQKIFKMDLSELNLHPLEKTVAAAQAMPGGALFWQDPTGAYELWMPNLSKKGAGLIYGKFASLGEVQDALALQSWKMMQNKELLSEAEKAVLFQGNEWLLNRGFTLDTTGQLLSGRSAMEAAEVNARRSNFLSPEIRSYVSVTEADRIGKSVGPEGAVIRTAVDPVAFKNFVEQGKAPQGTSGKAAPVLPSADGRGLIAISRAADDSVVAKADELAQKAIAKGSQVDPLELRRSFLLESGFDGIRHADGTFETLVPQQMKMVVAEVDPKTGRISSRVTVAGQGDNRIRLTTQRGEVVERAALRRDADKFSSVLQGTFIGNVDPKRARKALGLALGIDEASEIQVIPRAVKNGDYTLQVGSRYAPQAGMRLDTAKKIPKGETGGIVVSYPDRLMTPEQQRTFIQSVARQAKVGFKIDQLETALKSVKFVRAMAGVDESVRFKWLQDSVERELKGRFDKVINPTGRSTFTLELGGQRQVFKTIDEAQEAIAGRFIDEKSVSLALRNAGWTMSRSGEDFILRRGKDVIRAESLDAAVHAAGLNSLPISNRLAPKVALFSDRKAGLVYERGVIAGSPKGILKALDGFVDLTEQSKLEAFNQIKGDATLKRWIWGGAGVRVEVPSYGAALDFASVGEAKKFLEGLGEEYVNLESLRKVAWRKGVDLRYDVGAKGFAMNDGEAVAIRHSLEGVKKYLAEIPDGSIMTRSIFEGLPGRAAQESEDLFAEFAKKNPRMAADWLASSTDSDLRAWAVEVPEEGAIRDGVNQAKQMWVQQMETFDVWRDFTLRRINMPGASEILADCRESLVRKQVEDMAGHRLLEAIFRGEKKGALLPIERRKAMTYAIEAGGEGAEGFAELEKALGKFSKRELEAMREWRLLMGEQSGTRVSGLAQKYGISWKDYEKNFVSRIREATAGKAWKEFLRTAPSTEDMMRFIWPQGMPTNLKPWFEKLRVDEVCQFARDDDLLSVGLRYVEAGNRKLYLKDSWDRLENYLDKNSKTIPPTVRDKIEVFQKQYLGLYKPNGIKAAEEAGVGLMRAIGASPEQAEKGRDILKLYFSLDYATRLGLNPSKAIRNAVQVFSTHASRFGNDWVKRALLELPNRGEAYVMRLRKMGVLPERPPVVNELVNATTGIGKFTEKALNWFSNADEMSRAVAYLSVELRMNEAVDLLQRGAFRSADGVVDLTKFKRYAGLHLIETTNPETVAKSLQALQVGGGGKIEEAALDQARFIFGSEVVRQTMFDWSAVNQPGFFSSGFLGKLFSRWGSYAGGYRANIYRALSNGTRADKLAFVSRFIANNLALKGIFGALGITAIDFTPGQPALFGGGPDFDLAIAVLKAPSTGYKGAEARAELLRAISFAVPKSKDGQFSGFRGNIPSLLPGSQQFRYLQKAIDAKANGAGFGEVAALLFGTPLARFTGQ